MVLYLKGGTKDAGDKEILVNLGITHILNVTEREKNYFENNDDVKVEYKQIPLRDNAQQNISKYFKITNKYMDDIIGEYLNNDNWNKNDKGNVMLVHCQCGVSRSASIVIGYLMYNEYFKMKYMDAFNYVRKRRSVIDPNYSFVNQLKSYDADLQLKRSKQSCTIL